MKHRKTSAFALVAVLAMVQLTACGTAQSSESAPGSAATGSSAASSSAGGESSEEIIKAASAAGKIGNWGLGNEYEIQALLTKYGLPTDYITQDFTMDQFDSDAVTLASAMTYNELGLVVNGYDGGYNYGDSVATIDMNDEGVAMLEDNLFCSKAFAQSNPNTVKAFVSASMKGWYYACEHPDEAAQIVFEAGSSVSADHQAYMAKEVAKLVTTDMKGNTVSADKVGQMQDEAMQQTLDLAKKYIILEDASAKEKLQSLTLDDIRSTDYLTYDKDKDGAVEKSAVSVQLKWLPQAQFMGYYVAKAKGYYDEVGLDVTIVSGGGDISETTAVYNGTVDFGVTWVSNLINADAGGMDLLEVAQVYQRSGLVLVYKKK
ncbi:ABC transporter substrate-binding protein [Ruminococcus champanellensis]|uniref:Thiamine pyrimidine synthase n=1 Tax=Ruminococcus champanellensis (strain DSM 18848 / JCM 17042 / KCTC 15320 / 18P13) TaxID=213810 RepID=D4L9N0_RUMC1|nr:ABC transporter substrate-binding protein [Ruminococcus champanellensis]CBL16325.1 ABC-type nitrate/sulfonate/bicarbonate transport systems, periplasmic components [Ruminococcus champanellensis 18P13 = JCM 17042]